MENIYQIKSNDNNSWIDVPKGLYDGIGDRWKERRIIKVIEHHKTECTPCKCPLKLSSCTNHCEYLLQKFEGMVKL